MSPKEIQCIPAMGNFSIKLTIKYSTFHVNCTWACELHVCMWAVREHVSCTCACDLYCCTWTCDLYRCTWTCDLYCCTCACDLYRCTCACELHMCMCNCVAKRHYFGIVIVLLLTKQLDQWNCWCNAIPILHCNLPLKVEFVIYSKSRGYHLECGC